MKLNSIGKLLGIASISYFSAIVAVNQLLNVSSLKVVAVDDDTEPTGHKSSFTEELNNSGVYLSEDGTYKKCGVYVPEDTSNRYKNSTRIYTKDGKAFAVIDSEGYLVRVEDTF